MNFSATGGPGMRFWVIDHIGDFQQVYGKFVLFQGFSIFNHEGNPNWGAQGANTSSVGHAFVRVNADLNPNFSTGACFASESGPPGTTNVNDNSVLFTLVVIGR
jgi:hypothetical protein